MSASRYGSSISTVGSENIEYYAIYDPNALNDCLKGIVLYNLDWLGLGQYSENVRNCSKYWLTLLLLTSSSVSWRIRFQIARAISRMGMRSRVRGIPRSRISLFLWIPIRDTVDVCCLQPMDSKMPRPGTLVDDLLRNVMGP